VNLCAAEAGKEKDVDFELTKEQKQIQKAVREFVKGEFKKGRD
jgi:hypothetical protein